MVLFLDRNIFSIYKITNTKNGKQYIGFTERTVLQRFKAHLSSAKCNSNLVLHKAIRKHGKKSFIWEVIYQSKNHDHCLKIMEPYFIKEYNTFRPNGYNMSFGGEFGTIINPSKLEHNRERMRQNNPMKKLRTNAGSFKKGQKPPPNTLETRIKKSISKLGSKNPNFGKEGWVHIKNKKLKCPHCHIIASLGNIKRWHFDNCKSKGL